VPSPPSKATGSNAYLGYCEEWTSSKERDCSLISVLLIEYCEELTSSSELEGSATSVVCCVESVVCWVVEIEALDSSIWFCCVESIGCWVDEIEATQEAELIFYALKT
jgi:hypothetical protein